MKKKKDVQLIPLTPDLRPALVEMAEDFQAAGEERFKKLLRMSDEDFFALLRDLETDAQVDDLPPGMAPQSTYWLIEGGATIVGCCRLRHPSTATTEKEDGQIDYDIRPTYRGKGYLQPMLALALEKAGELGLEQVVLTSDPEDADAIKAIEALGGQAVDLPNPGKHAKPVRRFQVRVS